MALAVFELEVFAAKRNDANVVGISAERSSDTVGV
jgi:hypothetical protein